VADFISPSERSILMSKIRSTNSKAELLVFTFLRREGIYFQKHYKRVTGSPDIALPRKKKAIFIDGDFWHGRTIDRIFKNRSSDDYWNKKIRRNIERDKQQREELIRNGWDVLAVWESDLKRMRTRLPTLETIAKFLKQ
jgi:DNA mismatch endonuclease (patch repair protein)